MAAGDAAAKSSPPDTLNFLSADQAYDARTQFGTPLYVYDLATLEANAAAAAAFPAPKAGVTARYAMKSSPNAGNVSAASMRMK